MSAIEIRAEFLRIARAWTLGATGDPTFRPSQREALRHVYIEPHEHGGVRIVSSDGGAMCIQVDYHGSTDGAYLIEGLTKADVNHAQGKGTFDRWFEADPGGSAAIMDGVGSEVIADLSHVKISEASTNPRTAYPDWREVLPSFEELRSMQTGFPGYVSVPYLALIGRMWNGYLNQCRTVQVLSHGDTTKTTVLQFLWRPDMYVVISPQMNDKGMPTAVDLFGDPAPEPVDDDDEL